MEVDANTASWLDAILSRSYDNARQLLRPDQDVNVRGAGGITALHVVARHDALEKLKKLLLDGADPHLTDDDSHTPLYVAQWHNHVKTVQYLIIHDELLRALELKLGRPLVFSDVSAMIHHNRMRRFRGDVRRRVEASSSKLISAARDGDLETVKRMVESNEITIDALDEATGETAFSAALAAGRVSVYEYLLANDAHIFAPCIVGGYRQSVLATAAGTRDVDLVRLLVARGVLRAVVDLDIRTSPLAEAVKSGSTEMVDALLELGLGGGGYKYGLAPPRPAHVAFDFSTSNLDDVTPWWLLAIACWQQDTHMIGHLFNTQAVLSDPPKITRYGAHALFVAVYQQNESIVVNLLSRGVSINERIGKGLTAVVAAVCTDSLQMLHFLIDRGADLSVIHSSINVTTGYSEGLLATALFAGAMACAHELLPSERRLEHLDQAFYVAARRNDVDFARLLLDIARPSTPRALLNCISKTSCPLMLDLLLSQCDEGFDFRLLNHYFPGACSLKHTDMISVFLAHGIDFDDVDLREAFPPLVGALVINHASGLDIARTLVENGIELASKLSNTRPLLTWLEMVIREPTRAYHRKFHEAGRKFVIAHGLHHYE